MKLPRCLVVLSATAAGVLIIGCAGSSPADIQTPEPPTPTPTLAPFPTLEPTPTATPEPASEPTPTATPGLTPTPTPIPTPEPTSGLRPGTYQVPTELQPGIYAGHAGQDLFNSCYWERLSGVSGDFSEVLANGIPIGQFYVEVLATDKYFSIDCEITPLQDWPTPTELLTEMEPGMYIVGRDISPGTYRDEAGADLLDSCYWERLSGVSGDFSDLITNDVPTGQFFVEVQVADFAFTTTCAVILHGGSPGDTPTLEPTPTATPEPASEPTPTSTPGLTPTPTPIPTPEPTSGLRPGTYQVPTELQPGIYAGRAGQALFNSCYWERLSGVSGDFSEILANGNPIGQFYVEVLPTDKYFSADCEITPLQDWPTPTEPFTEMEPGMYIVGRDISPGTYRGEAGTDLLDSCYWERLSGVSGEFSELITNDVPVGQFFVKVQASDFAFTTTCAVILQ